VSPEGPDGPYNPLEKLNLARSIELELLTREVIPLAAFQRTGRRKRTGAATMQGAGVYAIYYSGDFPPYEPVAAKNRDGAFSQPIYIGKAIPEGGRKGGLSMDAAKGTRLADRLGDHAKSIHEVESLSVDDFFVRLLVVDDIWIPLGENMLIETFQPVWNRAVDGFGNKVPGKRRTTQFKSPWDVLHPIRRGFEKLADSGLTREDVIVRVEDYLAGRPMKPLPKKLAEQLEEEADEALAEAEELPLGAVEPPGEG
jgi:hypothetical protein